MTNTVDRGVRLYVDDASNFFTTLVRAEKAVDSFGKSSGSSTRGTDSLNTSSATLAVTLGNLASRAISGVITGFRNMAQEAVAVVGNYERLSSSVTALTAKEIKNADASLEMTEALALAAPRAQELLGWIRQLAIKSPFDQEGVAIAFKTALAYGFTTDQAQSLTTSLINFAAATGQSSAVLSQLAYPLGQIRGAGKLLTQDLRQLTNAGVDVGAILKSMGYTWEDVSKGIISSEEFLQAFVKTMNDDFGGAAANTATTLNGLLNSIGDLKELSLISFFGPIKDEMIPLLTAAVDKFQTLIPVIGYVGEKLAAMARFVIQNKEHFIKLFLVIGAGVATYYLLANAGAIATLAMTVLTGGIGAVAAALGLLLSPIGLVAVAVAGLAGLFAISYDSIVQKTSGAATAVSDGWLDMGDRVAANAAQTTNRVSGEWMDMGDRISAAAREKEGESHGWGYNLIVNFAQGMADAMVAVINVLIQIGNAIAGWLAPGSPPKLLPEIDQWGTAAMNEFLRGFTLADFGIFNTLSGTLSSFIRDMGKGILPEEGIIPAMLGTRQAISAAIEELKLTGDVGESSFNKIFEAMGITNPEIEGYVRSMIDAAKASKEVEAAQKRLSEISDKFNKQLKPLNDRLAALYGQIDKDRVKDRRKELQQMLVNAQKEGNSEAIRRIQREMEILDLEDQIDLVEEKRKAEEEAAQKELDAALKKEKAAEEQMALMRMQVEMQQEQNRLIQEQLALMERLASGGGGGAGGSGGPSGGGGGAPKIPGGGGLTLPGIGDLNNFENPLSGFQETMDGLLADITAPFEEVKAKLREMGDVWADVFLGIRDNTLEPFKAGLQGTVDHSGNLLSDFSNTMGVGLHNAGQLWDQFKNIIALFGPWFQSEVLPAWQANIEQMKQDWAQGKENLEQLWTHFKEVLGVFGEWFVTNVVEPWRGNIENIKLIWEIGKRELEERWGNFKENIGQVWADIKKAVGQAMIDSVTAIKTPLNEVVGWITDKATDFYSAGANMIQGMINGASSLAQALKDAVIGMVRDALGALGDLLDFGSPSKVMKQRGKWTIQGFNMGLEDEGKKTADIFAKTAKVLQPPSHQPIYHTRSPHQNPRQTTVNHYDSRMGIGQVTANNGTDVALIKAMVREEIRGALR